MFEHVEGSCLNTIRIFRAARSGRSISFSMVEHIKKEHGALRMTSFRRPFSRSSRRLGALQLPLCGPARTSSTRHLPRWVSKSSSPTWNRTTLWCLAQKKPGSANCHTRKWKHDELRSKWWTQFVRKAHVWSQTCEFSRIYFHVWRQKKCYILGSPNRMSAWGRIWLGPSSNFSDGTWPFGNS